MRKEEDENFCLETESTAGSSTDTEEFLDLADLNDFMDCSSVPNWQNERQKLVDRLGENGFDDPVLCRAICISHGGLLNGMSTM